MTQQLAKLAQPIDPRLVRTLPGQSSAEYVSHINIQQYLVGILGRVPKQEVVREIYDDGKLTGCVLRLTTVIDDIETVVEEAGVSDNPQSGTNADRLKDAISDAYKRCAMRMTCGAHLWAQADYFLHKSLSDPASPISKPAEVTDG